MEKRKIFKISIIDKEISRTEFDRNTFYTSDSELTLVFKLIEKDYTYDRGEILLYNENDESFVTRQITKEENDFVYELDLDIIPHYGKWKAQLQLVKDSDVYTSKPFDFVIENDLSNLAPQPTLTDINNWSTLKQSANELIDEMQDIIVSVEKAELERVNQENTRQNSELKREKQENTRQNNESERENNEKQRRIAEFERVDKEKTRQHAEIERQTTFETAEQERQSAELTRIENENQRKIDHANRSAELAGKANKKQEDWITPSLVNGAIGTAQYRKNQMGRVEFRGRLKMGNQNYAFILPPGYRPNDSVLVILPEFPSGPTTRRVSVTKEGLFYVYSSSENEVSLDILSYPV